MKNKKKLLKKYKDKNFIARILNPLQIMISNKNKLIFSHSLDISKYDEKFCVFPRVVQLQDGHLYFIIDGKKALNYALKNNEYLIF